MFIVEVLVNPYNPFSDKMEFKFNNYSDCSNFIRLALNSNKDYSCLISLDDTSDKEV